MKLLVTGAAGMLGRAVVQAAAIHGHEVLGAARLHLDVTDREAVMRRIGGEQPEVVINCAAYTDVDGAESDPMAAMAVNDAGAGNVAAAAEAAGAAIIHVSTDYVFDGAKDGPWLESDPTGPLGAYGESKLAGEEAVAHASSSHAIVRTAWLFGAGAKNFVDTMLALGAEREEVCVVTDQIGCPTWTGHLAGALVALAKRPQETGIHHIAATGSCSWNDLASEVFQRAAVDCRVAPTTSDAFPRPAARPANSVLASERADPIVLPPWQVGVAEYIARRAS